MSIQLTNIRTEDLIPHPNNPRKDLGDLSELTESVKANGIMQNLTVVPDGKKYKVLIGHRRLAAAKAAGVKEVPCRIAEGLSDNEQLGIMLEENMQRTDLTIIEQAKGFQMMLDLGETVKTVAEKTGFSETTVRHRVELAKLPEEQIDAALTTHQITIHDLFELEKVKDIEQRKEILEHASSSWMIQNAVSRVLENEQIERAKEILLPLLEEAGVKKKKGFASWNESTEDVQHFHLSDLPKEINIKKAPKGKTYYWDIPYGANLYIYKITKKKEEKSGLKKEQEEKNRRRDALEQTYDQILEECRRFIVAMLKGDYRVKQKDELEIWRELWDGLFQVVIDFYSYIDADYMNIFDGETKTVEPGEVTSIERAIVAAWCVLEDSAVVNWSGYFKEETAEATKVLIKALEHCGFDLTVEDADKLLDGSHEYYTKDDE